jgi:phosphoglycerol geranylgeranyltransferase
MKSIYDQIVYSKYKGQKLLAILIDPDKVNMETIAELCLAINSSPATHILVGGSSFEGDFLDELILAFKKTLQLPILLFPGSATQISGNADGILFLSLLSGRNPDYLIEHQVQSVPLLNKTQLEVIPTAYILVESGSETAVARISKTQPLDRNNPAYILQTAQAGVYLGNKLIYLEAGSGAKLSVPDELIALVANNTPVPLIVGGGIRSASEINKAFEMGADMVVIGTAFENDINFFNT